MRYRLTFAMKKIFRIVFQRLKRIFPTKFTVMIVSANVITRHIVYLPMVKNHRIRLILPVEVPQTIIYVVVFMSSFVCRICNSWFRLPSSFVCVEPLTEDIFSIDCFHCHHPHFGGRRVWTIFLRFRPCRTRSNPPGHPVPWFRLRSTVR